MIAVYKKFFLMLGVTVLLCLSASIVWSLEYKNLDKSTLFEEVGKMCEDLDLFHHRLIW